MSEFVWLCVSVGVGGGVWTPFGHYLGSLCCPGPKGSPLSPLSAYFTRLEMKVALGPRYICPSDRLSLSPLSPLLPAQLTYASGADSTS